MFKYADIVTRLQPHQEAAVRRALEGNLILAHSTGSGKTLTSIAAADAIGKPVTVLTPASLVENFRKELRKHKKGGPPVEVISLPTAVSHDYQVPEGNTLIIDEAHSLRNSGTARQQYVRRQLANAGRVLALTGTPAYNRIEDWAPLANIVAKEPVVPEIPSVFQQKYLREQLVYPKGVLSARRRIEPGVLYRLKNAEDLKRRLDPYVDVFDADIEKPERRDETIHVPMSGDQMKAYEFVQRNMPPSLRRKIMMNLPPSKAEARDMNAFLAGVRQAANTAEGYIPGAGPGNKILRAVDELEKARSADRGTRALVYSNFLESGVGSYARELDRRKIPYGLYTGKLTSSQKKELVDRYNAGKLAALLVSGAGSEGLDLKGTRLIQLLEPHWNDSRIDQVIGRGIRYKSHDYLPKDKRNVLVQHYVSDLPRERSSTPARPMGGAKRTSVDNYLMTRAHEKAELMQAVKRLFEKQPPG